MNSSTKNSVMEAANNYRFLFADPPREVIFEGFKSEKAKTQIDVVPVYREMRTKIGSILEKITFSLTVNQYIRMPFRNRYLNINHYPYKDEIDYYIIVPTMSLMRWSVRDISKLKSAHKSIKLVLLILDSLHSQSWHIPFVRDKIFSDVWDLVITYDQYDAKEYGFKWLGYAYYPECEVLPDTESQCDALYIGFNKGNRNKTIGELFKKLTDAGVVCDFRIVRNGKENEEIVPGLSLTSRRYKYCEIASMAKNANCIVEVLMDGQMTQSYRYFEAITYNKKLLTNNHNVTKLPYYDSRYMKYFSSVEDIDTEWVRKKEEIDYGYGGEFSQIHLLEYIKQEFGLN